MRVLTLPVTVSGLRVVWSSSTWENLGIHGQARVASENRSLNSVE